jgi:hypothetical protein
MHIWLTLRVAAKRRLRTFFRRVVFHREQFQEFSIGIYTGPSPFRLGPLDHPLNPVLTRNDVSDVQAAFVADPFMLRMNEAWYMFFEVLNAQTRKGEIGLAVSLDGRHWRYQRIVLREPFHLSYPYVFRWNDRIYMVPESHEAHSVRLYEAVEFPHRWELVETLLEGNSLSDASVFRFNDIWWLLVEGAGRPLNAGTLRLFYAGELAGPWVEHPKSPLVEGNPHIARPAGRVLNVDQQVFRYAQDCYPEYGTLVRAFQIVELTKASYLERQIDSNPVLQGSGSGWNAVGMHHVDTHLLDDGRWIACVDGWVWRQA